MNSDIKMPERTSKRKARKDSLTSARCEPEASSLRTENVPLISDKDFSEISEKIEKSVCRRIKDTETGQREIVIMIENLSSKIDSLSGKTPLAVNLETNETDAEDLGSTSRQTGTNKLPRDEGQHISQMAQNNCHSPRPDWIELKAN